MRKIRNLGKHIFLILFSFICIFPFYWMIVSATNESKDITMGKLSFGSALMKNIGNAFANTDIVHAFLNSAFLAIVITVLSLLICSVAGYAFVIYSDKSKNILFMALIASMMVPFAAKIIPMFRIFSNLGLLNSFSAIIANFPCFSYSNQKQEPKRPFFCRGSCNFIIISILKMQ